MVCCSTIDMSFDAPEKAEFNQYWYSPSTIKGLVDGVLEVVSRINSSGRIARAAFLSTPSIYFSVPEDVRLKNGFVLFDYDAEFAKNCPEGQFFQYDFNCPASIPEQLKGKFDIFVIDPPFITHEVWKMYAEAVYILKTSKDMNIEGEPSEGFIVGTTVLENCSFLQELFPSIRIAKFQPSVPQLVYQYETFLTWESGTVLNSVNPEIPRWD